MPTKPAEPEDYDDQVIVPTWLDLDDVEVNTRLIRRGVDPVIAKGWVRDRQLQDAQVEITSVLERYYLDENDEVVQLEIPPERRSRR